MRTYLLRWLPPTKKARVYLANGLGQEDEVPGVLAKALDGGQCFCPCSIRTEAFTMVLTQRSLSFVEVPGSPLDSLGVFVTR